jgi:hypothetical protein
MISVDFLLGKNKRPRFILLDEDQPFLITFHNFDEFTQFGFASCLPVK